MSKFLASCPRTFSFQIIFRSLNHFLVKDKRDSKLWTFWHRWRLLFLCYNLHFYRNKEMQIVISDIYIIKSILRVSDFCLDIFYLCTFALFNNCMISKMPANRRAVSAGAFSTWWRYQPHHSQYYKNRDHKILLELETMQWHRKSHLNVAFVTFFITRGQALVNAIPQLQSHY